MEYIWKNKVNGITLIALVITIIILLILAGIGISALTQTGLMSKTKIAKEKTEYTSAKEKIQIEIMAAQTQNYSNQNENILIYDNFISNWDNSNNEYNLYMQRIVDEYIGAWAERHKWMLHNSFHGLDALFVHTYLVHEQNMLRERSPARSLEPVNEIEQ